MPPRYAPHRPLPPYAHVPGRTPHPVSHPQGHSFGQPEAAPPPVDPQAPGQSAAFLWGVDLFNHGYYWEAHETWEGLWRAAGRAGPTADFLKGLIKLAAAGVKAREGRPEGVRRHAQRAGALFQAARTALGAETARYLGLEWAALCAHAQRLADHPHAVPPGTTVDHRVWDWWLEFQS